MYDFGKFCYLDLQKTGSTLIVNVLKKSSNLPLLSSGKHETIKNINMRKVLRFSKAGKFSGIYLRGGAHRRDVLYFNSIRNPFSYYASLYNYGCDGKGALFKKMKMGGWDHLYDSTQSGFLRWANFVLKSENSRYIDAGYSKSCGNAVGFLSYRLLRLSMSNPEKRICGISSAKNASDIYSKYNITKYTIRNENLREDFIFLIENFLNEHLDKSRAVQILDGGRVNVSKSKIAEASMLRDSDLAEKVFKREALVFERFYPHLVA